jgi:hypothetical protein
MTEKGVQPHMQTQKPLPFGNQVRITSHGPFKGLNGTILQIDTIIDDLEEPLCFYLIALEKTSVAEDIWFEYHEVEFIGTPPSSPAFPAQIRPVSLEKRHGEQRSYL